MKNKQMLVDLYEFMSNFQQDHKFSISVWHEMQSKQASEHDMITCGTSCCAVGWAIVALPSWRENGFLQTATGFKHKVFGNEPSDPIMSDEDIILSKVFDLSTDIIDKMFYAAAFFEEYPEIDEDEDLVTPTMVAKRIGEVLEEHG